jgi:hypothetical protein
MQAACGFMQQTMCQFNNADEVELELNISDELLAQKNEKVGGPLHCEIGRASCSVLAQRDVEVHDRAVP